MTALVRGVAHGVTPCGPDTDRDQCPTNRRDGYAPTCGHPEADHFDHLCPEEGDVSNLEVARGGGRVVNNLATLIGRQQAALTAGYTADPNNGRRPFDIALLRRYVPADYVPADCVYFCPGCKDEWNRGIEMRYSGYWSWSAGADEKVGRHVLERTMREHEQACGPAHRMRIVEDPEGVPVAADISSGKNSE